MDTKHLASTVDAYRAATTDADIDATAAVMMAALGDWLELHGATSPRSCNARDVSARPNTAPAAARTSSSRCGPGLSDGIAGGLDEHERAALRGQRRRVAS